MKPSVKLHKNRQATTNISFDLLRSMATLSCLELHNQWKEYNEQIAKGKSQYDIDTAKEALELIDKEFAQLRELQYQIDRAINKFNRKYYNE